MTKERFKKFLPLILVVLGLGVLTAAILAFKGRGDGGQVEERALIEVSLDERPVARLTPTEDGHWLNLLVDKLVIKDAYSVDYELLYKLPDGRTQGVPGTVKLAGLKNIERELLLGSESSGKFRYDEGVDSGTLTLRYRNEKGKLLVKFTTEFSLISGVKKLESQDGKFTSTLASASEDFFVVMETFGIPEEMAGNITSGPYGVFNSSEEGLEGSAKLAGDVFRWTGDRWTDSFEEATGIFVGTSN